MAMFRGESGIMGVAARRSMLTSSSPTPAFIIGCYQAKQLVSNDGINWTVTTPNTLTSTDDFMYDMVTFDNRTFTGYYRQSGSPIRRGIMTTDDGGATWVDRGGLQLQYSFPEQFASNGNNRLLAGNDGLMWSTNSGDTWTSVTPTVSGTPRGVCYAAGTLNKWYMVTSDSTLYSTTTPAVAGSWAWTAPVGSGSADRIVWENGIFIVTSTQVSGVYTSTNPTSWTFRNIGYTPTPNPPIYSPELGIWAVGTYSNGRLATSLNGTSWTTVLPTGIPSSSNVMDVAWSSAAGIFVAIQGNSGTGYSTSPDGINWTARTFPASYNPRTMTATR